MNLKSHLYCLVAIVIWSTLEITGKLVGERIDPFTLTAWRFIIGGLALLPFAIKQAKIGSVKLNIRSILMLGSLGILNVCISMLLLQLAIFYGKASVTAVIVSMNPVFVTMFAILILKEKLSLSRISGLLIGLAGLIIIVLNGLSTNGHHNDLMWLSITFAVLAALTFGLYTVLTKRSIVTYGNFLTNSVSFTIGGVSLLLISIFIGKPLFIPFTPVSLLFTGYLGFVLTGFSYYLYFKGMHEISASSASAYFFLKPVIATILAYLILSENISQMQLLASLLIVFSLGLNSYFSIRQVRLND